MSNWRSQGHHLRPEGALDRRDAVWPSPQIEASRIAWPISRRRASSSPTVPWASRSQARQQLLADGPDPARHALSARLVAEERGDPAQDVDHVRRAVEDHHHARAERGPDGPRALECERRVERTRTDERAGCAAEEDRPDVARAAAAGHAAGQIDELAEGRPNGTS